VGGRGGGGEVPRLVRPADANIYVHTYVLEGGSGWSGVPPPPAGRAAPPTATRAPMASPLTAPKSEPESLPNVLFLRLAHSSSHSGVSCP